MENRYVGCGRFGYNVFDEPIQKLGAILDRELRISSQLLCCQHSNALQPRGFQPYLAQGIEHIVEEKQDLAFRNLCDVIHAFAGIISDSCILIRETCQHRRNDLFQVLRNLLLSDRQIWPVLEEFDHCLLNQERSRLQRDRLIHRFWHGVDGQRRRSRDIADERS